MMIVTITCDFKKSRAITYTIHRQSYFRQYSMGCLNAKQSRSVADMNLTRIYAVDTLDALTQNKEDHR